MVFNVFFSMRYVVANELLHSFFQCTLTCNHFPPYICFSIYSLHLIDPGFTSSLCIVILLLV